MRSAFFGAVTELARRDPRVMLLTGDLGFMAIERYREAVPLQFHNAGVSESNMVGMAAGLAMAGHHVFVYSIIPFITLRVSEFVRNDICYQGLPVTVVGVGAGYAYSNQGFTHHATEDLAIMRALPGLTVLAPADPPEVEACVELISRQAGPVYLRLGKAGEPRVHTEVPVVERGRALVLRKGTDATLMACGSIVAVALTAASKLAEQGVSAGVYSMVSVKPIDEPVIRHAAATARALATIEEHSIVGGLGSAVADVLASTRTHPPLLRFGFRETLVDRAGSHAHLLASHGVTADAIAQAVLQTLGRA